MKCTFRRSKFEKGYFEGIIIISTLFRTYILDFDYHAAYEWLQLYSCSSKRYNPKKIQYSTLQLMDIRKRYGKRIKKHIQKYLIKNHRCEKKEGTGLYFPQ